MVNLPAKAGDMGSDTGRFSWVTENLQKVSFPAGMFWHSKKMKTILVKTKLEVRESFPSPMQGNISPQKRGVMSECSATLVLQDITAET